ncbi:MAG: mechanosensitive ion channel [Phycisphaerae bacterium]|jgi:small-conductance mechanosensitive channel
MPLPRTFSCGFLVVLGLLAQSRVVGLQAEPKSNVNGDAQTGQVPSDLLLQQVPQTDEDVLRRIELARSRLAELRRIVETQSQPEAAAAAPLTSTQQELVHAWEGYLAGLQHFSETLSAVKRLSSPEHLEALTAELTRIREETSTLKQTRPAAEPTEEQVRDLQARVSNLGAQVSSLTESQARLAKQLAEGFQRQKDTLQKELEQLRAQREELSKRPAALPSSTMPATDQAQLRLEQERLDVRRATADLALHNLGPEHQHAGHSRDQGERRLAALQEQLTAAQNLLNALTEATTRARVKKLETAETQSRNENALRDLRLFRERVLLYYFQNPDRLRRLRDRFPQRETDRLKTRLDLTRSYWDRIRTSLDYRNAEELATLARQLRDERREFQNTSLNLRRYLSETLDEIQELQSVRQKALQRFKVLADGIYSSQRAGDAAARTQLETAITAERQAFDEAMRSTVAEVESLSARMEEAIKLLDERVADLQALRRLIRWARLLSRESGLGGADWSAASADLVGFWRARPAAEPGDEPEKATEPGDHGIRRELFGEQRDTFTQSRRAARTIADDISAVPPRKWAWAAGGVLLAALIGFILYRVARYRGVRLAKDIVAQTRVTRDSPHPIRSGLSARIDLMALNMVGDLAIPLLTAGSLLLGLWQLVPDDRGVPGIQELALVALGTIAAGLTVFRLVHHLFEAESPPHRPIPCSDTVAKHYRMWLGWLILFSVIVLVIPFALRVVAVGAALQEVFFEFYKAGFLMLLLLFLVRKERVLGLGDVGPGAPGLGWGLMLTWIAYPLLVLAAAALLVLQVAGYGMLVTYTGTALLLSLGILIVVGTAIEYLNDLIDRHTDRDLEPGMGLSTEPDEHTKDVATEGGPTRYVVTLLRWFIRIAGVVAAIVLILRAWDVPIRTANFNWGRIGLGALVVLLALLLDRLVLTTLLTLNATGRLPESTVNIIRRWVRGVLTLVAGLTVVAIAGFEIRSIWAVLATFLAMVAIGFVAVWSILSNILATLVILIWRPFNVGENITVLPEALEGRVVDINFMYTTLKTEDGGKIAIPNNFFAQKFIRRQPVRGAPKRTLAEQLESTSPLGE